MRTNTSSTQRNAEFLGQALALIDALPEGVYAARPLHFERGGLGVHLRHVLDHYDAFLDGLTEGRIDYDTRERDAATELEVSVARGRLLATIARLRALGPGKDSHEVWAARKLEVLMDLGGLSATDSRSSVSSIARELQYLVAHTVHHFALIAVSLRLSGHPCPADFGVAPSTLRHEESSSGACAR